MKAGERSINVLRNRTSSIDWALEVVRWLRSVGVDPAEIPLEHFAYVDIVLWAQSLHYPPTVEGIADRWSCSRASAYRWRAALGDAWAEARGGAQ